MADIGAPEIIFSSTTFDSDDCIQVASFTNAKEDITYRCGGDFAHLAGTSTIALSFSIALSNTDTSKLSTLAPGATGTCEYYPFGNTATYIKHSTTKATVVQANESDSAGKVVTLDVSIVWDDVTTAAAS